MCDFVCVGVLVCLWVFFVGGGHVFRCEYMKWTIGRGCNNEQTNVKIVLIEQWKRLKQISQNKKKTRMPSETYLLLSLYACCADFFYELLE